MSDEELARMFDELPRASDAIKKDEGEYEYLHRTGHFDLRSPLHNQVVAAPQQAKPATKKTGKIFQQLIVDSVKKQRESVTIDRLYDNGWHRNIGDYILQYKNITCWMEAKSIGTSLGFDKKGIRQKKLLIEKSERCKGAGTRDANMIGVLVEFKRGGIQFETWWVDIDVIVWLESKIGKKSFNPDDLMKVYIAQHSMMTFPIRLYKPKRARKDYLDIESMMKEGE